MYRVELKGQLCNPKKPSGAKVPNVPCGVERHTRPNRELGYSLNVPNVPCGVERLILEVVPLSLLDVPNVPCGVESL